VFVCVCVSCLSNLHAKRLFRIMLPCVLCLSVPYYSTLSHKRQNFQKGLIKIPFLILSTNTLGKVSFLRKNLLKVVLYIGLSLCRIFIIFVRNYQNVKFHYNVFKVLKYQLF
jgi:hypothetical protein